MQSMIVIALVTFASIARADESPSQPRPAKPRVGVYSELSSGAGVLRLGDTGQFIGEEVPTRVGVVTIHHAAGVIVHIPNGPQLRAGAVLDLMRGSFDTIKWGTAYGAEVQADWALPRDWRLGPRASLTSGTAKPFRATGDGPFHSIFITGGMRARYHGLMLGADVVIPRDDPGGAGAMFSAGYSGKYPAFATAGITLIGLFLTSLAGAIST